MFLNQVLRMLKAPMSRFFAISAHILSKQSKTTVRAHLENMINKYTK